MKALEYCNKETSDSKYLFGEKLLESMKEAKELS